MRTPTTWLLAGIGLLLLCVLGGIFAPLTFFAAYLTGFLFIWGLTLGSMAVVMLYHLSAGRWGRAAQRPLEAATRTLPLIGILFVPLLIGWRWLYPWAHPDPHQAVVMPLRYLNGTGFMLRAIICFVIWFLLIGRLNRLGDEADPGPGLRRLSAPGLILWGLTVTVAAIDWTMSLYPGWMSTVYACFYLTGQGISAFALAIVAGAALSSQTDYRTLLSRQVWRDWGNLLLTALLLWAYVHLSQLIIIWSGNLPDGILWYVWHTTGSWRVVTSLIGVAGFALPFGLLLFRAIKDRPEWLCAVAILLLLMRWIEMYWQVAPALHPAGVHLHWLYPTVGAALFLIWLGAWRLELVRRPLVPPAEMRPEWGTYGG